MTRATLALASLLRAHKRPLTARGYFAYVGRLIAFYGGLWLLTGVLALIAATAYALASAPQIAPETPRPHGCSVILPDPVEHDEQPSTLHVRTLRPLSECDGSAPVSFGASIRDSGTGRAR